MAKVEEKPRKLEEAGVYAAVNYSQGDWIVFVCWYMFGASKKDDNGDRFYTKGALQWVPCGSIVRGLRSKVKLHWNGRRHQLKIELLEDIDEYGDVSV